MKLYFCIQLNKSYFQLIIIKSKYNEKLLKKGKGLEFNVSLS